MYLHQKFAFPAACLVFGLLALSLGVSNSKDSKHASFVVGLAVVFVFYTLMMIGSSLTKAHVFPASLARWLPNIVLGLAGVALLIYRHRHADAGVQFRLPSMAAIRDAVERRLPWRRRPARPSRRRRPPPARPRARPRARPSARRRRRRPRAAGRRKWSWSFASRERVVDLVRLPRPTLLDAYVGKAYLRVLLLAFAGLLGIFYIGSFIDWSDNLFKGQATTSQLAQYMWYSTPQFVYYVLPLSALVGTLVTIGLLTKSSELIIMRACGVSLYRTALPLLVLGLLWSGLLFGLEESFLAASNRKAAELKHLMRGGAPRTFDVLARQWVAGRDGRIYRYTYFDPRAKMLTGLEVYRFQEKPWGLAESVTVRSASYKAADSTWLADQGWDRRFADNVVTAYTPIAEKAMIFEAASYFGTEQPDADRLSFTNLRRYIAALRVSGFDVVPYRVALHRKIAFPFVALVMTLIAIPFAVTMGRRGALFGIGLGLLLAISYWGLSAVFSAIGGAGLLVSPARRLGAERPVRLGRQLPAADRADVAAIHRRRGGPARSEHFFHEDPAVLAPGRCSARRAAARSGAGPRGRRGSRLAMPSPITTMRPRRALRASRRSSAGAASMPGTAGRVCRYLRVGVRRRPKGSIEIVGADDGDRPAAGSRPSPAATTASRTKATIAAARSQRDRRR